MGSMNHLQCSTISTGLCRGPLETSSLSVQVRRADFLKTRRAPELDGPYPSQHHRDDPRQGTVADGRVLHTFDSDASDEPLEEAYRGFAGLQGGESVEVTDDVTKLADVDFPWRHVAVRSSPTLPFHGGP
jgi:hypothetical protein